MGIRISAHRTHRRTDVDSLADKSSAEKRGGKSDLATSMNLLISHKELDHFHMFTVTTFIMKADGILHTIVYFKAFEISCRIHFRKFKQIIFEKK